MMKNFTYYTHGYLASIGINYAEIPPELRVLTPREHTLAARNSVIYWYNIYDTTTLAPHVCLTPIGTMVNNFVHYASKNSMPSSLAKRYFFDITLYASQAPSTLPAESPGIAADSKIIRKTPCVFLKLLYSALTGKGKESVTKDS